VAFAVWARVVGSGFAKLATITPIDRDLLGRAAGRRGARARQPPHGLEPVHPPVRRLAVKVALLGLAALLTAGAFSLLLTWWASPLDRREDVRFSALVFATRDITPLGYADFALGTTIGLLIRRTLPAMAITLAAFIAVQILFAIALRHRAER
jgi:hypothetical protein